MNVQIAIQDELTLHGIATQTTDTSGCASLQLARALNKRIQDMPNRANDKLFILSLFSEDYMPGRSYTLFAGFQSNDSVTLPPEGMTTQKVKAHQYAVIPHHGSVQTSNSSVLSFRNLWLPRSDYSEASSYHFQIIDSNDMDKPSPAIDIWFPVQLKKEKQAAIPITLPSLKYDGGFIQVLWDYHEAAVEWYSKHFHWTSGETHTSRTDKLTRHAFGTWIKSVLSENGPHPELADRGVDPNVRWCWNTRDIVETYTYFKENHIRLSEIYLGPGNRYYFDLWTTYEGTRLTVCGYPELEQDYGARLCPGWVRIGVSNIDDAKQWYQKYIGMSVLEEHLEQGCVLMGLGVEHHPGTSLWWLETLPPNAYTKPINGTAAPYCVLHDKWVFLHYHQYLNDSGVNVSNITGNVDGFARFHFFDPDGNRFNIQKY